MDGESFKDDGKVKKYDLKFNNTIKMTYFILIYRSQDILKWELLSQH